MGLDSKEEVVMGFGWSFYGFLAAAVAWMVLYFVWVAIIDSRERRGR